MSGGCDIVSVIREGTGDLVTRDNDDMVQKLLFFLKRVSFVKAGGGFDIPGLYGQVPILSENAPWAF